MGALKGSFMATLLGKNEVPKKSSASKMRASHEIPEKLPKSSTYKRQGARMLKDQTPPPPPLKKGVPELIPDSFPESL